VEPPSDGHDAEAGAARVVYAALAVNLAIASLKGVVAAVSGSTAMLAEALHSVADCGNQVCLIIGMRLAARGPDEDHPFGRGAERYFWAFMAALLIFSVGGTLSIYEGVRKLAGDGAPVVRPLWAFVVLGGSFVFESLSFRVALGELRATRRGRSMRQTIREARDPTVLTVLFEDAADLVGLLIALAGVALTELTGSLVWDGIASILVGLVLVAVAVELVRSTKSLLIGRSVPASERRRIEEIARAARDVVEIVHIRTVHLGPDEAMAGLKLRFAEGLETRTLEARINELEAQLRAALPHLKRIYVEPGFDERAARARRPAAEPPPEPPR